MQDKIKWRWSLLFVLVSGAIMQFQGRSLKTALNPIGIIDLELADTVAKLNGLMADWNVHIVRLNIWIDFLFIAAYTFFFLCSIKLLRKKLKPGFLDTAAKLSIMAAYGAALLDTVENSLMLCSISGNYSEQSLRITALVATVKFLLIGCILIYLAVTGLFVLGKKPKN